MRTLAKPVLLKHDRSDRPPQRHEPHYIDNGQRTSASRGANGARSTRITRSPSSILPSVRPPLANSTVSYSIRATSRRRLKATPPGSARASRRNPITKPTSSASRIRAPIRGQTPARSGGGGSCLGGASPGWPQLGAGGGGSDGVWLPGGPHVACCWAGWPTAAGTKVAPHWLHQVACGGLVAWHRGQRISIVKSPALPTQVRILSLPHNS
jgi:hypothetical protein